MTVSWCCAYFPYCSLHIIYGADKENLFNNQDLFLVIVFLILVTLMFETERRL